MANKESMLVFQGIGPQECYWLRTLCVFSVKDGWCTYYICLEHSLPVNEH